MLAALSAATVVMQRGQTRELDQVVQVQMPAATRIQKIAERITGVHAQLYLLLTNQAPAPRPRAPMPRSSGANALAPAEDWAEF